MGMTKTAGRRASHAWRRAASNAAAHSDGEPPWQGVPRSSFRLPSLSRDALMPGGRTCGFFSRCPAATSGAEAASCRGQLPCTEAHWTRTPLQVMQAARTACAWEPSPWPASSSTSAGHCCVSTTSPGGSGSGRSRHQRRRRKGRRARGRSACCSAYRPLGRPRRDRGTRPPARRSSGGRPAGQRGCGAPGMRG